jgi:uncharacterized protein (TIGR02246 family)
MTKLARSSLWLSLWTIVGCAQPAQAPPPAPPDTRADEAAIHANVKDWSAAAQAKDADKFASFYAEDGVLMLENSPDFHGKAAIREAVGALMQDPHFALSFAADSVVVARSGDLAYETGTYALTLSDPKKKPSTQKGHYVVVWQKQADGSWRAVRDAPVSDPPAESASQ